MTLSTKGTPRTPAATRRDSTSLDNWNALQSAIVTCERCPRLRAHCLAIAAEKRAAFRACDYWGKPLPNLGPPNARVLIVGLAPAAHGGNRTGRMFTGDRSGDFLFRALYETGFANQPNATDRDDGLELRDLAITAVCHCAPPDNKPLPIEIENCSDYLRATFALMPNVRVVVALGRIGFDACLRFYRTRGWLPPAPRPQFSHGANFEFPEAPVLLASFHPSQQNTFTRRLTPEMFRGIFERAREISNRFPAG